MAEIEKFIEEYGELSHFYDILSCRQRNNPMYLKRNRFNSRLIRNKSPIGLNCSIQSMVDSSAGTLISCLLSADCNKTHVSNFAILSFTEINSNSGGRMLSLNDFTACSSKLLLALVVFIPSSSVATGIEHLSLIKQLLNHISSPSDKTVLKDIFFEVGELLPKSRVCGHRVEISRSKLSFKCGVARLLFQPIRSSLFGTTFTLKPMSKRFGSSTVNHSRKSGLTITLQLRWEFESIILEPTGCDLKYAKFVDLSPPSATNSLFIHYLFPSVQNPKEMRSIVEHRKQLGCPFCSFKFNREQFDNQPSSYLCISHLMSHMLTAHFYCRIEGIIDHSSVLHLIIQKERLSGVFPLGNVKEQKEFFYSKFIFSSVFEASKLQVPFLRPATEDPLLTTGFHSIFDESNSVTNYNSGNFCSLTYNRQFYHARAGVPIGPNELSAESDDEIDICCEVFKSRTALDEFEDVSIEEKQFIKLWNSYVQSLPALGDCFLPLVFEGFVLQHAEAILSSRLRYHMVLHLLTYWDFGLLRSDEIQKILSDLDFHMLSKDKK